MRLDRCRFARDAKRYENRHRAESACEEEDAARTKRSEEYTTSEKRDADRCVGDSFNCSDRNSSTDAFSIGSSANDLFIFLRLRCR